MAIVVFEKWKSRAGKQSVEDPSITIVYGVKGTLDDAEVDAAIESMTPPLWPPTVGLLQRQSWQRECLGPTDDGGLWEVSVLYDRNDPKGAGTALLSADISGGRVKITQSKETIAKYGIRQSEDGVTIVSTTTPPDFQGAIGVTDTNIEGVEIVTPKMELTITATATAASLDSDFLAKLDAATGKVNDAPFEIFYKGQLISSERHELLFLGGPATYRGNGDWEFALKFIRERTVTNIELGGSYSIPNTDPPLTAMPILVSEKLGHQYLWINYKEKKVGPNLVRIPQGAYVERVYDEENFVDLFAPLGIGG